MKTKLTLLALSTLVSAFSLQPSAFAQGTAFTYQGRLHDNGSPANGTYDLRFGLWNAASNGAAVAQPLTNALTAVSNGLFDVTLDFGAGVFNGAARWLEIGVRTNGSPADYVILTPRQSMTATPYAMVAFATSVMLNNQAPGRFATVGGGSANWANYDYATVGGGFQNVADGTNSVIGGGSGNLASGKDATVAGGSANWAVFGATVGGGRNNSARQVWATIAGGSGNAATETLATVGGGNTNTASGVVATVSGGQENQAAGYGATVGGGNRNLAGDLAVVAGGSSNAATNAFSAIGGGTLNTAGGRIASIGGGERNQASGTHATVGGGQFNKADGAAATVPGGDDNWATGDRSFAAGSGARAAHAGTFVWADSTGGTLSSSQSNQFLIRATGGVGINNSNPTSSLSVAGTADFTGSVGIGMPAVSGLNVNKELVMYDNDISFRRAGVHRWRLREQASSGLEIVQAYDDAGISMNAVRLEIADNGRIGIGTETPAAQLHVIASSTTSFDNTATFHNPNLGPSASHIHYGVNGDWYIRSAKAAGKVVIQDTGGNVGIGTTGPTEKLHVEGNIFASGTITPNSDRTAKTGFAPVDPAAVLERVAHLPIQQWRFKAEAEGVKHFGPMAQDFQAAFGLGGISTAIATVDADGVALAAIQGLNQKVEVGMRNAEARSRKLEAENAELKAHNDSLEARLERLERLLRQAFTGKQQDTDSTD